MLDKEDFSITPTSSKVNDTKATAKASRTNDLKKALSLSPIPKEEPTEVRKDQAIGKYDCILMPGVFAWLRL